MGCSENCAELRSRIAPQNCAAAYLEALDLLESEDHEPLGVLLRQPDLHQILLEVGLGVVAGVVGDHQDLLLRHVPAVAGGAVGEEVVCGRPLFETRLSVHRRQHRRLHQRREHHRRRRHLARLDLVVDEGAAVAGDRDDAEAVQLVEKQVIEDDWACMNY
mgnify:CR=1 FL=1